MKTENILDAMGDLDEMLLTTSLPQKRRNLRPLAVAAILAATLCVTAGAGMAVFSQWTLEDKGKADPEAYRAEAEERWPDLSEEVLEKHIRRNAEKFTYRLTTTGNHPQLEEDALQRIHQFLEPRDQYKEFLYCDTVEEMETFFGLKLPQAEVLTLKEPIEVQMDYLFDMEQDGRPAVIAPSEEAYTVHGEVFSDAIPYGFQIMAFGDYAYAGDDRVKVSLNQEFYTVEGRTTATSYHLEKEAVFSTEKIGSLGVRLGLAEDCAVAFFVKDEIACSLCITGGKNTSVTGGELEAALREILTAFS